MSEHLSQTPEPSPEAALEQQVEQYIAEQIAAGYDTIAFRPAGGFYACREGEFSREGAADGYENIHTPECKQRLMAEMQEGWH